MSADTAIDAVVTAIERETGLPAGASGNGRLGALSRALDSLVHLRETDRRAPAEPQDAEGEPQIIDATADVIEWLRAQRTGQLVYARLDGSYWQRGAHGLWYTTGSSTGFTSDDLAARGPFERINLA